VLEEFVARAVIDNLHDRVGEEEQLRGMTGGSEYFNGVWARGFFWDGHHDGGRLGVYSDEGPTFDYHTEGLQVGVDIYRREHADGMRDHAGVYFSYARAYGTVEHVTGVSAGSTDLASYALGGYWTHFWANGAYLDGIVQYSWYDAKAVSTEPLPPLKDDGHAWTVSLEGARPFHFAQQWVLEPQGQLTYVDLTTDPTADAAATVTFSNTNSLVGRLGLRLARTWAHQTNDRPILTTGWLRLNFMHEFLDQPKTFFSAENGPVAFPANAGHDWMEANAGLTHQLRHDTALYASGGYLWSLGRDTHGWTAKVGLRFNW
jgi:outer membrane autotransporter protein